jgi:hypothetical protein
MGLKETSRAPYGGSERRAQGLGCQIRNQMVAGGVPLPLWAKSL